MQQTVSQRNWFSAGGSDYAQYRPRYPAELAAFLASLAPDRRSALDVGCGNGQLTCLLADYFESVTGTDPSETQIQSAIPHERVVYHCAPAEALPQDDKQYSLITAAQAAHWFQLEQFYREVKRIAAPGAVIALISYGVLQLDEQLNERFLHFYHDEIGPYWPSERRLVDNGYRDICFPFNEITTPSLQISYQWNLQQLLGYISTWSAVTRAREAGNSAILQQFSQDIEELWGDAQQLRAVNWPVIIRAGKTG
ncbi:class I SAM-dependent methyltransferase [Tatumella citrea]|uniref:SAM-dependent methyltransferase n=1 Tax=Tatumella citrea TaxID=53336 RepID=A0A1Y0L5G2_TATCI|nr:class I SAM-dependent methyltransferase [Tatumella citrea]ARU92985.1 SAM-dependent methyltransferase [Tatumella citrea]ARU97023.1 SAM-dependent methyltransferase [Tatumella citrea]